MVESFLSSDDKPPRFDKSYRWVGKCRKNGLKKGGVGLCLKSDIMILDDNLNNSQHDEYERLWVLVRLNNIKVALGVAYFPNDGTSKPKTDELFFELLENTSSFASSGYEVILMGDFNGRCVTKCPFSDKNIPHVFQSYNGNRLRQFIDASELCLVNTMPCCKGIYTRILNNQRSTIDYILLSDNLSRQVKSAAIDDDGSLDLNSDHVVFTISLLKTHLKRNKVKDKVKWKLSHNTDWDSFQEFLCDQFKSWNTQNFNRNIEAIWNDWLTEVTMAAESTIGKSKRPTNFRSFWDKELDALIKSRRIANQLKRIHDKSRPHDSETGLYLTETYKKRKLLVQNAIKMKEQNSKMKLFKDSCASSKAKSKGFWSFLKGKKCHDYPAHIVDPDNKNNILTEEIDIKISL